MKLQLRINGLAARVLAAFVALFAVVLGAGLAVTTTMGTSAARKAVSEDVVTGARMFERWVELDTQRVVEGARALSREPALRDAVAAGDRRALHEILAKQAKKLNVALLMVLDPEHALVAGNVETEAGRRIKLQKLVDRAALVHQASGMVPIGGQFHQLAIVPVLAPQPVAWLLAGVKIGDAYAQDMRSLTGLELSFFGRIGEGEWRLQASTLAPAERARLAADLAANRLSRSDGEGNAEYGSDAVARVVDLAPRADDAMVAVLQAPLAAALAPVRNMQMWLALIAVVGMVAGVLAGWGFARWIARPVTELSGAVRRAAAGDYAPIEQSKRGDEIGDLSRGFRRMQETIASTVARMTDLAHRDTLTGLPTRVLFMDRLEQAIGAGSRVGAPVAVLVLDVENFGELNETLGHRLGDLMLREVAARLRAVVRRTTDTVARIGPAEFAIMLTGSSASDAQRVAEGVHRSFDTKMTLDGHIAMVRASIGIAASPDHGNDSVKLFQRADVAMHSARSDRLGVAVWDARYDEHGDERLAMLADLRKAVDNGELALTYQPRIRFGASSEHYVEALVRWQHPTRGVVAPSDFVPHAEQTGYIRMITQWVLSRAIAQCAEWRNRGIPINVSINISGRDLVDSELPRELGEILEREGCAPQWIALEVNEGAIVGEPGHAIKNLERIHALGVRLAVDDYGTGYSSLAYLRRLPLDELKIDKSFILRMGSDASDALIVRSTIELAHRLELDVAATGVEDEATLTQLRELGCDTVQGFLLSRPLAADDVPGWLRESAWTRSAREKGTLRRVV